MPLAEAERQERLVPRSGPFLLRPAAVLVPLLVVATGVLALLRRRKSAVGMLVQWVYQ